MSNCSEMELAFHQIGLNRQKMRKECVTLCAPNIALAS